MEKRENLKDGFKWIFTDGKESLKRVQMDLQGLGSNGSLLMEKRENLKDGFKWIFTDGKERKPQGWVQMDLY